MFSQLIGITLMGSMRPYFRKHVLDTLDSHDFLFINAFIIAIIIFCWFLYTYFFENHVIKKTYKNCCDLTLTQFGSLFIIALLTVLSSFLIIDIDKNYNTPSLNNIIIKAGSIVSLFLVGMIIFKETYNLRQITGIVFCLLGLIIIFTNPMKKVD